MGICFASVVYNYCVLLNLGARAIHCNLQVEVKIGRVCYRLKTSKFMEWSICSGHNYQRFIIWWHKTGRVGLTVVHALMPLFCVYFRNFTNSCRVIFVRTLDAFTTNTDYYEIFSWLIKSVLCSDFSSILQLVYGMFILAVFLFLGVGFWLFGWTCLF